MEDPNAKVEEKEDSRLRPAITQLKENEGFATSIERMKRMAEACEKATRYQDGADIMVQIFKYRFKVGKKKPKAELGEISNVPEQAERDMLSNHFKNLVGDLRQAYRTITNDDINDKDDKNVLLDHIKAVMIDKSEKLIELIKTNLFENMTPKDFGNHLKDIQNADNDTKKWIEDKIFYLKMCGDYHRYIAEITKNDERNDDDKKSAKEMYSAAMVAAKAQLQETNPTRLGLALNWSVCCYELLEDKKTAKEVAKGAFDNAIQKLDTLNDNSYKDSTLIMQLLRDNLTIWTGESGDNQQEDQED